MYTTLLIAIFSFLLAMGYLVWRLQAVLGPRSEQTPVESRNPNGLSTEEKNLLRLVRGVPKGRVTTFAVLARLMEGKVAPSNVARMVHQLAEQQHLPWWRIVRKDGRRGLLPTSSEESLQRKKLVAEGVVFEENSIPLKDYEWEP